MIVQGTVIEVSIENVGDETVQDHLIGDTILYLSDTADFSEAGGQLMIEEVVYTYIDRDDESSTLTLSAPLAVAVPEETPVYVYPLAEEKQALVMLPDEDDATICRIPHQLQDMFDTDIRYNPDQESVYVELEGDEPTIVDVRAKIPRIDGSYIEGLPPAPPPETIAPDLSPIPDAAGGVGALFISWDPVGNSSPFDVEVHISLDSGFLPVQGDPATLVATVNGSLAVIRNLPDGSPLEYQFTDPVSGQLVDRVYYVRLIAVNEAGVAPASPVAFASMKQINSPDIATNAIWAGTITADRITGGNFLADVALVGSLTAEGASGEQVTLSGSGFYVKGPDALGNPDYVKFPTDGRPNIISGVLQATTLSVSGNETGVAATFFKQSSLEPNATLLLKNQVGGSVSAPVLGVTWDFKQKSDSLDTIADFAYYLNNFYVILYTGSAWVARQYTMEGAYTGTQYTLPESYRSIVRIGTSWYGLYSVARYMSGYLAEYDYYVDQLDASFNKVGASHYLRTQQHEVSKQGLGCLGVDGTSLILGWIDNDLAVVVDRYSTSTWGRLSSLKLGTTMSGIGNLDATPNLSSVLYGNFDFGSARYVIASSLGKKYEVLNSTGVLQPNEHFSAGLRTYGVTWDGTRFWGFSYEKPAGYTRNCFVKHSTIRWTTESSKWWFSSTRYDPVNGYESEQSSKSSITMERRAWWTLTANHGEAPGSRIYLGRGTSEPLIGAMFRQDPALSGGVIATTRDTALFSGSIPPSTSSFPPSGVAVIKSQKADAQGPIVDIRGDGYARLGELEVFSDGTNNIVPSGCMMMFGGVSAPRGWLFCRGQLVNIADYPLLYNSIGHTHNNGVSPGSGLFKLPDMRMRGPIGADPLTVFDRGANEGSNSMIDRSDSHSHSHSHSTPASTGAGGAHTHAAGGLTVGTPTGGVNRGTGTSPTSGASHGHDITGDTGTFGSGHDHVLPDTNSAVGIRGNIGSAHAYTALHFIIKY